MEEVSVKFSVYFEDPFWIGMFERKTNKALSACKVTFGAEPKDNQIYEFILKRYNTLKFSQNVETKVKIKENISFKRTLRALKNELKNIGIGTKSQQALKLQYEQNKVIIKTKSKEEEEFEKERKYSLRQQKKKEKHKGK